MKKTIKVKGSEISVYRKEQDDYISLTDIARHRDAERTDYIIQNWLRNRNTIEFLGIWEQLNNPDFKPIEFDGFRKQAGLNSFVLTAKRWIEQTGAIPPLPTERNCNYPDEIAYRRKRHQAPHWPGPRLFTIIKD